jgi:[ribosomal protein S18]-alanine N-acetyltransferase
MTLSQGLQKVTIRRMTPADLDAVVEIDSISFSLPWPRSSFGYELNNPVSRLWVAEAEEAGKAQVVGMICTWVIENEGHIATFAIHPDFRRRGLGNALLGFALLEAAHEGVELVYLEVRRSNEAAIQMYERFGFAMTGIRASYYSDNHEDALMMTLEKLEPTRIQALLEN